MKKKKYYVVRVNGNIFRANLTEEEATQIADKFRTEWQDLVVSVEKNIFGVVLSDILPIIVWFCLLISSLYFLCRLLFF